MDNVRKILFIVVGYSLSGISCYIMNNYILDDFYKSFILLMFFFWVITYVFYLKFYSSKVLCFIFGLSFVGFLVLPMKFLLMFLPYILG